MKTAMMILAIGSWACAVMALGSRRTLLTVEREMFGALYLGAVLFTFLAGLVFRYVS